MTKSEQQGAVLLIDPQNELKFKGPFTAPVVSYIKLTNLTDREVYFKLKTTAPKKYCVRPNSGHLTTKEAVEVQVVLQPFIFNPADKHKHKFMVQYVVVENENNTTSPDELWKCIAPDKIMNYKLKCVFEMPSMPGNDLQPELKSEIKSEPVASDEKIRKYSENYKTAGKTTSMGNGSELEKVAAELKTLREENNKIQAENFSLKDQLVRMHRMAAAESNRNAYHPPATRNGVCTESSGTMPMYYIAIAVLIATFSFIFGKFV